MQACANFKYLWEYFRPSEEKEREKTEAIVYRVFLD